MTLLFVNFSLITTSVIPLRGETFLPYFAAIERYSMENPYSKNCPFDKPIAFSIYASLFAASYIIPDNMPQKLNMAGMISKSSRSSPFSMPAVRKSRSFSLISSPTRYVSFSSGR